MAHVPPILERVFAFLQTCTEAFVDRDQRKPMGYNVYYRCTLRVDDPSVDLELSYDRGHYGWGGDTCPPNHPGEGLRNDSVGEYRITVKDCKVRMKLVSEKFHAHYMTRLLALLKKRVPSLHGYVSCDMETFWIVTDVVMQGWCPSIHEYARVQYESSDMVQRARKRSREEAETASAAAEAPVVATAVVAAPAPAEVPALAMAPAAAPAAAMPPPPPPVRTPAEAWARAERATAEAARKCARTEPPTPAPGQAIAC